MIRKFSFWIVFILIASIGSMVFIHWKTLQGMHQKTARVQPLYQRQKALDSLILSLERYRRLSSNFRKLEPAQIAEIKDKLRVSFTDGVTQLDLLDPTPEERTSEHQLSEQLTELLSVITRVEPMLFSKDSYQKPEVQGVHEQILENLNSLEKSNDSRIQSLNLDSSRSESQSLVLLLGVGTVIFVLMLSMILRSHFVYLKPLNRLYLYANELKAGKVVPSHPPHFIGMYADIQSALNQLALGVETHMRDRHKFILDIVEDLKSPLTLLQAGKYLLGAPGEPLDEERQVQAAESVRRGLAIFAGSLEDLNDIVDINRLESRLEEKTIDLSELLSDVSRTLMGSDLEKKLLVTVPPIPVWVLMDSRRFERVLIQVLSKVLNTIPGGGSLSVTVAQATQGNARGIEILIQESDRIRSGRTALGGPEQDILKHWISENGLSMALAYKIIKAHGGTITAAGVAGMSVSVMIRLPQERVVSRGLISPPTEAIGFGLRGHVTAPKKTDVSSQNSVS